MPPPWWWEMEKNNPLFFWNPWLNGQKPRDIAPTLWMISVRKENVKF
jgi:hypothetical protein